MPERGIELLSGQILKAQQLLAAEPINQNDFHPWDRTTRNHVEKAFGENHPNVESFEYMCAFGNSGWDPAEWAEHYAKGLKAKIATLNGYIDELKTEISGHSQVPSVDFFDELDSAIRQVSQQLFKDSHYAESVSAAFKELNGQVQEEYKKRRGVELARWCGSDAHSFFEKQSDVCPRRPIHKLRKEYSTRIHGVIRWLNDRNPKSARPREPQAGSGPRKAFPLFGQPPDEDIQRCFVTVKAINKDANSYRALGADARCSGLRT